MKRVPSGQLMAVAAQAWPPPWWTPCAESDGSPAPRGPHRGLGNNGGDALFARPLARRGLSVKAITVSDTFHDAGAQALLAAADPGGCRGMAAGDAAVVIDGIVGIGARGPLRPEAATVVQAIPAGAAVFAVDSSQRGGTPIPAPSPPLCPCRCHRDLRYAGSQVSSSCRDATTAESWKIDIGLDPHLASLSPAFQVMTLADAAAFPRPRERPRTSTTMASPGFRRARPSIRAPRTWSWVQPDTPGVGMVRLWQDAAPQVAASVVERFPMWCAPVGRWLRDPKATAWIIGQDWEPARNRPIWWPGGPGHGAAGRHRRRRPHPRGPPHRPARRDRRAFSSDGTDASRGRVRPTGVRRGDDRGGGGPAGCRRTEGDHGPQRGGTVIAGPTGPLRGHSRPGSPGDCRHRRRLERPDRRSAVAGSATTWSPQWRWPWRRCMGWRHASPSRRDDQPITAWDLVEAVPAAVGEVRRLTPP